ncbi:hypothetical protein MKW94_028339 [Papaver nudicaule]|uniref:LOB domain-containing protein n=1 Tax=Papaver nudicaule TaxID=74823 RepID=A0AA41RUA3_PAPNU|nr:hypothetical protein [Papaver nudicaule]
MSCNGCRVLRKGCSESCILRPCLQWIESPEAQGHATVFVAKFFGRAGLMSFISAVPESQRPALFQSLLFEACGRTVNPVNGAVGLLWTGNWQICQTAVETVLRGGTLRPISDVMNGNGIQTFDQSDDLSVSIQAQQPNFSTMEMKKIIKLDDNHNSINNNNVYQSSRSLSKPSKRKVFTQTDLDLSLTTSTSGGSGIVNHHHRPEKRRSSSPSMNSEESVTTSLDSSVERRVSRGVEIKALDLFV